MSDTILVMNEGRPEQIGSPREVYNDPNSEFVADFMGDSNILNADLVEVADGRAVVDLRGDDGEPLRVPTRALSVENAREADPLALSLRAEDLRVTSDPTADFALDGTVRTRTFQGKTTTYLVDVGDAEIQVESSGQRAQRTFDAGDEVAVAWNESDCLFLYEGAE